MRLDLRLRDLCRDLFLRVGVEPKRFQPLVDGVEGCEP